MVRHARQPVVIEVELVDPVMDRASLAFAVRDSLKVGGWAKDAELWPDANEYRRSR